MEAQKDEAPGMPTQRRTVCAQGEGSHVQATERPSRHQSSGHFGFELGASSSARKHISVTLPVCGRLYGSPNKHSVQSQALRGHLRLLPLMRAISCHLTSKMNLQPSPVWHSG